MDIHLEEAPRSLVVRAAVCLVWHIPIRQADREDTSVMVIAGRVSSASFSEGSKDKNGHNWAEQTRSWLMLGEFKCGWVAHPASITAGTISVAAEAVKWIMFLLGAFCTRYSQSFLKCGHIARQTQGS